MGSAETIRLAGMEALQAALRHAGTQAPRVVGEALMAEARLMLRDSLNEVPVKDAILKASGQVLPPIITGSRVVVKLGYGGAASAYALYQHNAPAGLNYTKPGSKSHYLSDPVQAAIPRLQAQLAVRIGRLAAK